MNLNKKKKADWSLLTEEEYNSLDHSGRYRLKKKREKEQAEKQNTGTEEQKIETPKEKRKTARNQTHNPLIGSYYKTEYDLIGTIIRRDPRTVSRHIRDCNVVKDEDGKREYLCVGRENGCPIGTPAIVVYINCENYPNVQTLDAYLDKIQKYGKEEYWNILKDKKYIDKRYLMTCHKYSKSYKLVRLVELDKKQ